MLARRRIFLAASAIALACPPLAGRAQATDSLAVVNLASESGARYTFDFDARAANNSGTGFDQTTVNLHIVQSVAGETVDLVDDAVGDLMRGDVLQHPLQVWPVS